MTPTHRDLATLAAHHHLIAELLAHPQVQAALIAHYHDLHGHGLKASQSDADGSRASTPTSGPENAVTTPPDAATKAAANIRTALGNAKHANAMLSQIINDATTRPKPAPMQCPSCTEGRIHPGQTRCDHPKCNTHIDTRERCAITGCDQILVKGATGKTKRCKLPDGTPVCDTHRKQASRRGWHTINDYQLGNNVITTGDETAA